MEDKKKVLIITYYWPPSGGAGVQRWLKFAKYLPTFNWQPIIYTPLNPESPSDDVSLLKEIHPDTVVLKTKIWEPYRWYKKILGQDENKRVNAGFLQEGKSNQLLEKLSIFIRGNFFIPDARRFWIRPSIKYLSKYIQSNKIDIIVSTGPPHSMHLIALKLKEKLNIKWIADFRDPWTNIDFYKGHMLTKCSDRKHKRLEKKVISTADYVTIVGDKWAEELRALGAGKVKVITNGYDEEDLPNTKPNLSQKFSITHVGSINKDRNHPVFFNVLKGLTEKNQEFKNNLEIKFIGKLDHAVLDEINKAGLSENLTYIEYISHSKVVNELMKSRLLYLPINNTPNAKGILTGKFFEYLAAQRPILTIGPTDGDIAKMLQRTKSGEVFDFDDFNNITSFIWSKYLEYKKGLDNNIDTNNKEFTRKNLTKQYSTLLTEICNG